MWLAAKALAERNLLKRDGKNMTCKVTIPEHERPRVHLVSGSLLKKATDPAGQVGQCPTCRPTYADYNTSVSFDFTTCPTVPMAGGI
jgi:hypothetical protein